MTNTKPAALKCLGDLLGSLQYMGQCARCGGQFMSTHDLVLDLGNGSMACEHCAKSKR